MTTVGSARPAEAVVAYVGVGSNLDDPVAQVSRAIAELRALPQNRCARASSLYRNPPMGPPDQPDYVNAVVGVETTLAPHALLDSLQRIERDHERVRAGQQWGPRTLDLDLLLYGGCQLQSPRLRVPHPGLAYRCFVLVPLAEIDPRLYIPGQGPIERLLEEVERTALTRLDAAT